MEIGLEIVPRIGTSSWLLWTWLYRLQGNLLSKCRTIIFSGMTNRSGVSLVSQLLI
jgi:hypothetical protein